jgi:CRISPR-associated protein Csm3
MSNAYPIFEANLILKGKIVCETGLHIGGSKEKLEIGGIDSPVIRDPKTRFPYIPGSSIKGKMRHLLEYINGSLGETATGQIGDVSSAKDIVRIFGIGADEKDKHQKKEGESKLKNVGLTRLVVRDAMPDATTIESWEELDSDLEYTEFKPENTIDRVTSAANPRFIERVVAGSRFNFEMVYSVYKMSDETDNKRVTEDLENIILTLRLLESSFLGKSGSRGYGKVKLYLEDPHWLHREDYIENEKYKMAVAQIAEDINALKPIHEISLNYEL